MPIVDRPWRLSLSPPFSQGFQDDGRAAQGDQKAPEDCGVHVDVQQVPADDEKEQDAEHLGRSSHEEQVLGGLQLRQRKFQADGEQQKHHPNLGQHVHLFQIGNEVEPMGTHERPDDQEARNRGQVEFLKQEDHRDGHGENDDDVPKCAEFIHRAVSGKRRKRMAS